jgi:hypothetical protein
MTGSRYSSCSHSGQAWQSAEFCRCVAPAAAVGASASSYGSLLQQADDGHTNQWPSMCAVSVWKAVCSPGNSQTHAQNHKLLDAALQVLTALAKLALLQVQHPSEPSAGAAYAASVRQLVSELGVLWVKLGQTLSVRPDLVGKRLAAALAGLQVGDWRC